MYSYTSNIHLYHCIAQIDTCNATLFKWIFMLMPSQMTYVLLQRLKCQSDLVITSTGEKVTDTKKKTFWFVNTKVYSLRHFLISRREEGNRL